MSGDNAAKNVSAALLPRKWPGAWYGRHPELLVREIEAMLIRYPDFEMVVDAKGVFGWTGTLKGVYEVRIRYPDGFPHDPPAALILRPPIKAPHLFSDGRICLAGSAEEYWTPQSTAVVVVSMASHFLARLEHHAACCRRGKAGKACLKPHCPDWNDGRTGGASEGPDGGLYQIETYKLDGAALAEIRVRSQR